MDAHARGARRRVTMCVFIESRRDETSLQICVIARGGRVD